MSYEDLGLVIGSIAVGAIAGILIGIAIGVSIVDLDSTVEERLKLMEMCQNEIFYNSDSNYKRCDNIGVTPE